MFARKTKTFAAAAMAVGCVMALTACTKSNEGGSTTVTQSGSTTGTQIKLISSGKLTTCTALPYKPFQFQEGSKVVGFDVDIIDAVAKKLNVTQEIVAAEFEGIQSGQSLNTGKCDLAAAGMTITDKRKTVMDFSNPYFDATQVLLVKKDSGIKGAADLAGKTLGVQDGTTGEEYANKNIKGATIKKFSDLATQSQAVKTGQVHAAINDNGVLYDFVKDNADMAVTTEFATGEQYGFSVKKDNKDLLTLINSTISELKSNGEYDKIYKKWFGVAPKK